jgi:uncharacterized protein (TIGR02271 family)
MSLYRIKDFDPDYRAHFEEQDLMDYDLYAGSEKVGSVNDLLVDDEGRIRYLIINTGAWIFGKKVLLPIGRAHINYKDERVVVNDLTREQVEALPEYDGNMPIDYDYEERVRGVYRPPATSTNQDYDRNTYAYNREPDLYNVDEEKHQKLRLYEERLIANKTRAKTGEVAVGKRVETETAKVSVPIEKERVIIERTTPSSQTATPDHTAFQEGEVARVELYEETPDIHKEAFVREEVNVRKEVEQKTVDSQETLRREELDIDTQGRPVVEGNQQNVSRSKARNR